MQILFAIICHGHNKAHPENILHCNQDDIDKFNDYFNIGIFYKSKFKTFPIVKHQII